MNKPSVQVKSHGRRFWIEIPAVEWILEFDLYRVGKNKNGLLIAERWTVERDGGVGWVIYAHKDFQAILDGDGGRDYENDFLRALAHKLGIEKLPWTPLGCSRPLWLAADEYLEDHPRNPKQLRARQERAVQLLEAEGRFKEATAFRKGVGLPAKPKLIHAR